MASSAHSPESLLATVSALREHLVKRLEADSLDAHARHEMETALEELEVMWEELRGEAALLLRENERYAEFFQYAPDACLITDALGSVCEVNQAALELLGTPREEVLMRPLSDFIAGQDRGKARLQPPSGAPLEVEFSVRALPLRKSGGGLCWLIRPS